MRLTTEAVEATRKNMKLRNRLSIDLDRHYTTILRFLDENEQNGMLTTATALRLIEEETALTQSEILTEEKEVSK